MDMGGCDVPSCCASRRRAKGDAMPISVKCNCCGQAYRVPDTAAGKTMKCKKCTLPIEIPSSAAFASQPMAPVAPPRAAEPPIGFAPEAGNGVEPPRAKTQTKKKKSNVLIFVFLGLAAAFFFCFFLPVAVGVGWWYFSSSNTDGMKFMPANSNVIMSMRGDDMLKSDVYQQVIKENPDLAKKINELNEKMQEEGATAMEDMGQTIMGGDFARQEFVSVTSSKKKTTIEQILQYNANRNKKFKQVQVGKYTMYEEDGPPQPEVPPAFGGIVPAGPRSTPQMALCVIDNKMVLAGTPKALKEVLERDKKPEFSEGMQAALKYADFSKAFSVAINGKGLASNLPAMQMNANPFTAKLANVQGGAINVTLKTDILIDATILCADDQSAEDLRKLADGGIAAVKIAGAEKVGSETVSMLDSLKLANQGNTIVATMEIKTAQIIKATKSLPALGGPMGGPQPIGGPGGLPNQPFPQPKQPRR
jgi:hypothetical protein